MCDSPFPNPTPVTEKLERMYAYTEALAGEFDKALSETHPADGGKAAWAQLKELPKSKDLLAAAGREDAENTLKSWKEYVDTETTVLKLLTEVVLS